jgi:hypothetical protein
MILSSSFYSLIDSVATLVAGEREVIRTYFEDPLYGHYLSLRNNDTDKLWLIRQCSKEIWSSPLGEMRGLYVGPMEDLLKDFPRIDIDIPRANIANRLEVLHEEFTHYCAFAEAYDACLEENENILSPSVLWNVLWDGQEVLRNRRAGMVKDHGVIGERACYFSEGGWCILFSEGMKLKGNGGIDDKIAHACSLVYEDEWKHMCSGIIGLDDLKMGDSDWKLLTNLSIELFSLRIHMRNSQFSFPLDEKRIHDILNGDIEPVKFDFKKIVKTSN